MALCFPSQIQVQGTEVLLQAASPRSPVTIEVDGAPATVLGIYSAVVRFRAPPKPAGAYTVSYYQTGNKAGTLETATLVYGAANRLYLALANFGALPGDTALPCPSSYFAAGTWVNASTSSAPKINSSNKLVAVKPPGSASLGYQSPVSNQWFYGGTGLKIYGQFHAPPFVGLTSIAAGTWKFSIGQRADSGGGTLDKLAIYIYRPGTNAKVGTIYDNTGDTNHLIALADGTAREVFISVQGSAVNGVQDGDVLVLEVGSYLATTLGLDVWFNGATEQSGVNGAALNATNGVAAYLEMPGEVWMPPLSIISITPDHGPVGGGTRTRIVLNRDPTV